MSTTRAFEFIFDDKLKTILAEYPTKYAKDDPYKFRWFLSSLLGRHVEFDSVMTPIIYNDDQSQRDYVDEFINIVILLDGFVPYLKNNCKKISENVNICARLLKNKRSVDRALYYINDCLNEDRDRIVYCKNCNASVELMYDEDEDKYYEPSPNIYMGLNSNIMKFLKAALDGVMLPCTYELRMLIVRYLISTSYCDLTDDINAILKYEITTSINVGSRYLTIHITCVDFEDVVKACSAVPDSSPCWDTICEYILEVVNYKIKFVYDMRYFDMLKVIYDRGLKSRKSVDHYVEQHYTFAAIDLVNRVEDQKDKAGFDINRLMWTVSFEWGIVFDVEYKQQFQLSERCNKEFKKESLNKWLFIYYRNDESILSQISKDIHHHRYLMIEQMCKKDSQLPHIIFSATILD